MNKKILIAIVVVLVIIVGGFWYESYQKESQDSMIKDETTMQSDSMKGDDLPAVSTGTMIKDIQADLGQDAPNPDKDFGNLDAQIKAL